LSAPELVLLANARLPSRRAQSLQVLQMAAGFARAGARTTLLHARRHETPALPAGQDLFDYYAVPPGPRPAVAAVPCVDWIDRTPTRLQFAPARVQELSFARNAAGCVRRSHAGALVLSREIEAARLLVPGRGASAARRVFLELHRVPGGLLRRRWLLRTAPACGGIVAISNGVRDDLIALGVEPGRIRVEHDAADLERFRALPERAAARRELALAPDAPLVVYAGGLRAWKGVELLAGAARRLPDVRFVVAGGLEQDVARIRALFRGLANVRIDGFQPPARVPLYLAAGDVGVVPNRSSPAISARYTSPLKVFEALAAGLPLVASDLPSLRELLRADVDAVLVAPDDEAALADGIARLLGDAELRASFAARGRARAPERSYDARARRILAWMQEAA
jgi:glycosyltransferase involved in cell wall biosynthesis